VRLSTTEWIMLAGVLVAAYVGWQQLQLQHQILLLQTGAK